MESKKIKRDLIILLVSTFIVIVCWIGFNIYSIAVTSTIDQTLVKQVLPIAPSFDTATINNLINRKKVPPLYQMEAITLTPTPESPTSTPIPSPLQPRPTDSEVESQNNVLPSGTPAATGGATINL